MISPLSLIKNLNIGSKLNFDDVYNIYLSLEKKQQLIVTSSLVFFLLLVVFIPLSCVSAKLDGKRGDYEEHVQKASELFGVLAEIKGFEKSFAHIKTNEDLGSDPIKKVLYMVTDEIGIERQRVVDKKANIPSTDKAFIEVGKDVELKNILFSQTVDLLHKLINNSELPLNIKKLQIKVDPKNKQVMKTVSLTITTIEPKEKRE